VRRAAGIAIAAAMLAAGPVIAAPAPADTVDHHSAPAGVVEVTSPVEEERTRIWQSAKKPDELYPFRATIKPILILDEDRWLDAEPYHDRFSWTQKWPRANWTLAYQGNLHEVPQADFDLLQSDMAKAARSAASR